MRDMPYIPLLYYSSQSWCRRKLKGWEDNIAERPRDPLHEHLANRLDCGARRLRPARAACGHPMLRYASAGCSRDPDAVRHRHDRVLPDPHRARRPVRPGAAAGGEGDGEPAARSISSISRSGSSTATISRNLCRAISGRASTFATSPSQELLRRGPADFDPARRRGACSWRLCSAARSASSPRSARISSSTTR